jgi:hypothetical protein
MKWRLLSFIFIPLILASCTAYHYIYQTSKPEKFNSDRLFFPKDPIDGEFKDYSEFQR